MDELLLKYADTFDENFPIFCFTETSDTDIKDMIQKCLDDGEPFEFEPDTNVKY